MGEMTTTVAAALLAFVSTNVDDLFLLLLLFAQRRRSSAVVLGQYAGVGAIVILSLVVSSGARFMRPEWVGFLGVAPIAIGLKGFWSLRARRRDSAAPAVVGLGVVPIATVTFASGGDNIAVYAPLFAGQRWSSLVTTLLVFALMVAVWCFLAHRLVRLPALSSRLDRLGHAVAPLVLVGLGLWVFATAGTYGYLVAGIR